MNPDQLHTLYMQGLENRLVSIYQQSKSGTGPSKEERHKFEGYMQAGIETGLVFKDNMQQYIHQRHQEFFGTTIAERKK